MQNMTCRRYKRLLQPWLHTGCRGGLPSLPPTVAGMRSTKTGRQGRQGDACLGWQKAGMAQTDSWRQADTGHFKISGDQEAVISPLSSLSMALHFPPLIAQNSAYNMHSSLKCPFTYYYFWEEFWSPGKFLHFLQNNLSTSIYF